VSFEYQAGCLLLLQDPFGNYVVQYVLELGDTSASGAVMRGLAGHWPDLAQQKFSSNVVEKCLKLPGLAATQVQLVLRSYVRVSGASFASWSLQQHWQGCVPRAL
jgi:Pumilio-family RNA binding repeat